MKGLKARAPLRPLLGICAIVAATSGLTACNEDGGQTYGKDWITSSTTPVTDPTPTPSSTPSPNPTPSPSPSASPSPGVPTTDRYTGPAEVAPYVQKFIDDATLQGVDVTPDMSNPKLTIQIASLSAYGSSVIGLCESGTGTRRVTFEPTFWNSVNDTQRELLAHHELGHCVLYRPHTTTLLSSGAYGSIMYPIIMASSTYTSNYAYYQQELFSQAALAPSVEALSQSDDPNAVTVHICDLEDLGLGASAHSDDSN